MRCRLIGAQVSAVPPCNWRFFFGWLACLGGVVALVGPAFGVEPIFQRRGGLFEKAEILELEMREPLIYRFARVAVIVGVDLNLLFDPIHYWRGQGWRRVRLAGRRVVGRNRRS